MEFSQVRDSDYRYDFFESTTRLLSYASLHKYEGEHSLHSRRYEAALGSPAVSPYDLLPCILGS
jgi:hypothetical protein